MKRFLLLLAIIPMFIGCDKDQLPEKCGIYVNGKLACELKSAFVGGGTANPSIGSSNRMHIYEEFYSEGPKWNEVKEKVLIVGFRYTGKECASVGESISRIDIYGLSSLGDIRIPMNQGKYEGGNELVSSVKVVKYSFGNISKYEDSTVKILVTLKDKQTIAIVYSGMTPYDGYV